MVCAFFVLKLNQYRIYLNAATHIQTVDSNNKYGSLQLWIIKVFYCKGLISLTTKPYLVIIQ